MSLLSGQSKKDLLLESNYLKGRIDQGDTSSKTLNRLSAILDLLHEILKG